MSRIKTRYIIVFFIVILSISIIASSPIQYRQFPTHLIVRQVFCVSCHTDEYKSLEIGNHIYKMNTTQSRILRDYVDNFGNTTNISYKMIEAPCYTCHVTYENYDNFGLTDPYVYAVGNIGNTTVYDAKYGKVIEWLAGNAAVEYGAANEAITAELQVISVTPSNAAVDSTLKIILSNYAGQQTGNTVFTSSLSLYQGNTQTLAVDNIVGDYFNVSLLLEGSWTSTTVNLLVSGTDRGTQSFTIDASNPPAQYYFPQDRPYFKTNGSFKAQRLDYIWAEWMNYTIGNIASDEIFSTNNINGKITSNTCSSPDAWCHINQKATSIGMSDGTNPDKSFYLHKMEYVTSKQCKICHLDYR